MRSRSSSSMSSCPCALRTASIAGLNSARARFVSGSAARCATSANPTRSRAARFTDRRVSLCSAERAPDPRVTRPLFRTRLARSRTLMPLHRRSSKEDASEGAQTSRHARLLDRVPPKRDTPARAKAARSTFGCSGRTASVHAPLHPCDRFLQVRRGCFRHRQRVPWSLERPSSRCATRYLRGIRAGRRGSPRRSCAYAESRTSLSSR